MGGSIAVHFWVCAPGDNIHNIFKGCLTLLFKIKIDNNFDNKFYRNRAEQYRIILFWRSIKASPVPGNPRRRCPR